MAGTSGTHFFSDSPFQKLGLKVVPLQERGADTVQQFHVTLQDNQWGMEKGIKKFI